MAALLEHFAVRWNHLKSQKCGKNKQIGGGANACERIPL